jgi:hypothetical protein
MSFANLTHCSSRLPRVRYSCAYICTENCVAPTVIIRIPEFGNPIVSCFDSSKTLMHCFPWASDCPASSFRVTDLATALLLYYLKHIRQL